MPSTAQTESMHDTVAITVVPVETPMAPATAAGPSGPDLSPPGCADPAAAPAGHPADCVAGTGTGLAAFATATFADLAQVWRHRPVRVLDVRHSDESTASRIRGSANIPLNELPGRVAEVPAGEIWVHCATGYRASIAASFLAAAGRHPIAIDDAFGSARQSGLPLVGDDAA
jgi:rhodanese-related sulfurtransferase